MLTLVALSLTWAIEVIKRIRSRSLKKIRFTYFNKKKRGWLYSRVCCKDEQGFCTAQTAGMLHLRPYKHSQSGLWLIEGCGALLV